MSVLIKRAVYASTLLALGSSAAHASGFRLPEVSIAGLGMSNALVANERMLGAVPYNPAAMTFHDGAQLAAGATVIQPDLHVDPALGTPADSQGRDNILTPNLAVTGRLDPNWAWGLVVNAPFGLETDWPAGTFGEFQSAATTLGNPQIAALAPGHSEIEMLNFNPNVAYRINNNTSVAFGLDFYQVRSVKLNTVAVDVAGSGDGLGVNAAVMHDVGDWTFGASYRSSVGVDINGNVSVSGASTKITFPWMLQVGAKYQPSDKWSVEFDVERTGWSDFDRLQIDSALSPTVPNITSTNNWDDSNAYRLGGMYKLTAKTELRLGYTLDQTPQGDAHFSARVPDADRQLFSIGLAQDMGGWSIEAGYMYVKFDDRTVNSSQSYTQQLIASAGANSDPNGTSAYNGTYQSSVSLFGLGVTTRF